MKRSIKKFFLLLLPFAAGYKKFSKSLSNNVSFYKYAIYRFKINKSLYWPIHKTTDVTHPENIFVGINSAPGIRRNSYIQGNGKIFIGDYVRIAANVAILSANHDIYNQMLYVNKETIIGDYTWIGMNCVILPGVVLGIRTIVGAGSVVTKSFPDGYCIIAGNPAKLIKKLDDDKVVKFRYEEEYYGFIPKDHFKKFRDRKLKNLVFNFDVSKVTKNPLYS